jgi:hypothetical protein
MKVLKILVAKIVLKGDWAFIGKFKIFIGKGGNGF